MSTEADTSPRIAWEEPNAVQIHVVLEGIEPPIWRRLVVPLAITLAQLHHILQAAMGWNDSHLHQFEIGGLRFGDTELLNAEIPDDFQQAFDAAPVRLRDFHWKHDRTLSFVYNYDFGDSWAGPEDGDVHRGRALLPARGCRRSPRLSEFRARAS